MRFRNRIKVERRFETNVERMMVINEWNKNNGDWRGFFLYTRTT